MRSSSFFQFYIFTVALCILPVYGSWFYSPNAPRGYRDEYARDLGDPVEETASLSDIITSTSDEHLHPAPSPSVIFPSKKSQGMLVTSIVPVYEACTISASSSQSCSTAYKTIITPYCSTVLTGFFTKITVTDCKQEVTFSTQTSYALTTVTSERDIVIGDSAATATSSPAPTAYVQKIVAYYISPWEAIAAGKLPPKITVNVCTTDESGTETCEATSEVWKIHVEYVQVTTTHSISISESFKSPVLIGFFDGSQELTAPAGKFAFETEIGYKSRSTLIKTSTSRYSDGSATNTMTETSTLTRTITGPVTTITRTISEIGTVEDDRTTTITSTILITSTVTVGGAAGSSSVVGQ